jgi:hypothetical protein
MAPSRAYVPSLALLRALSRPLPSRCSVVRPLPTQFFRGKRSKASADRKEKSSYSLEEDHINVKHPGLPKMRIPVNVPDDLDELRPMTEEEINDPDLPVVEWYEQDLDAGTPERLMRRYATPEDWRKHNEMSQMIAEDMSNPDYDDAHFKRKMLDDLMENPHFADLTAEIKMLKADILTREEEQARKDMMEKKMEEKWMNVEAEGLRLTHETLKELINDPDLSKDPEVADSRADLVDMLDQLPAEGSWDDADFIAAMEKIEPRLAANPAFVTKFDAKLKAKRTELGGMTQDQERQLALLQESGDLEKYQKLMELDKDDAPEGMEKLLMQMKDVMEATGVDRKLESEMEALLHEGEDILGIGADEGKIDREMDFQEISEEIERLAKSDAAKSRPEVSMEEEENVDPELVAKVDKIMQDPKLMEKLQYIQEVYMKAKEVADITNIPHEVAPDPLTLDPSRTTGIQDRLQFARSDPEHSATLAALQVKLPSPFNVSPALKLFNQAIELAYVGANDDVRRILWRAYSKARTLPTFLRSLSDDAWDLIYYSQSVTWKSNQNRFSHLKLVLDDLKSVGKNGPPTHPSKLVPKEDDDVE